MAIMRANGQLLGIIYAVMLVRTSEGVPFSDCMADIDGPYTDPSVTNRHATAVIRASESQPAVFYCSYTCHQVLNRANRLYNFRLYVDILKGCSGDKREMIELGAPKNLADFNFTVTTTTFNECNPENNETTFEAQIFVGPDAPTVVAKCAIDYFPDGDASRRTNCSSSSTFAITYNDTTCTRPSSTTVPLPSPTSTASDSPSTVPPSVPSSPSTVPPSVPSSPSTVPPSVPSSPSTVPPSVPSSPSTVPPSVPSSTSTVPPSVPPPEPEGQISSQVFGSLVGVLFAIVAIETILLIVLVYFFVKYKKSQGANSNEVVVIHHSRAQDAETDNNNSATRPGAQNNGRVVQRINSLPNAVTN